MPKMRLVKGPPADPRWTEQRMADYCRQVEYDNSLPGNDKVRFDNGDLATGQVQWDEETQCMWFGAVDSNGQEYQTQERPALRIDLTNVTIISGTVKQIQATIFSHGEDLPLFTGQPANVQPATFAPKAVGRQLDMFKETSNHANL